MKKNKRRKKENCRPSNSSKNERNKRSWNATQKSNNVSENSKKWRRRNSATVNPYVTQNRNSGSNSNYWWISSTSDRISSQTSPTIGLPRSTTIRSMQSIPPAITSKSPKIPNYSARLFGGRGTLRSDLYVWLLVKFTGKAI